MEKIDWKLMAVLGVHLLAVGTMYGRITSDVTRTGDAVHELKASVEDVRKLIDVSSIQIATLAEGRKSDLANDEAVRQRLSRIESSIWTHNNK